MNTEKFKKVNQKFAPVPFWSWNDKLNDDGGKIPLFADFYRLGVHGSILLQNSTGHIRLVAKNSSATWLLTILPMVITIGNDHW